MRANSLIMGFLTDKRACIRREKTFLLFFDRGKSGKIYIENRLLVVYIVFSTK
jgi:hypothetical protein